MSEYPEGKIRPDDEGALNIAVGRDGECVFIAFQKPVMWFAMEPEYVDELIENLQKHKAAALEVRRKRKPQ
jgi:uncharacterized protein (DUF169 family)